MPHWALKHLNNQAAGQGPGGPGQPNEAFVLNKSSNALCQGSVGWQGQSWDHPVNCSTGQEAGRRLAGANRSRRGPCSGTRAHHQSLNWWTFGQWLVGEVGHVGQTGICSDWGSNRTYAFIKRVLKDQRQNEIISWQCSSRSEVGIAFVLAIFISNWPLKWTDTYLWPYHDWSGGEKRDI